MNEYVVKNLIAAILSFFSVIGALANADKKIEGFYIWIAVNIAWIFYCLFYGVEGQIGMWVAYIAIAVYGIVIWKEMTKEQDKIYRFGREQREAEIVAIVDEMIKQTGQPGNGARGNGKVAYMILSELLKKIGVVEGEK